MPRDEVIQVKCEFELKGAADKYASSLGWSTSSWVRGLIIQELSKRNAINIDMLIDLMTGHGHEYNKEGGR